MEADAHIWEDIVRLHDEELRQDIKTALESFNQNSVYRDIEAALGDTDSSMASCIQKVVIAMAKSLKKRSGFPQEQKPLERSVDEVLDMTSSALSEIFFCGSRPELAEQLHRLLTAELARLAFTPEQSQTVQDTRYRRSEELIAEGIRRGTVHLIDAEALRNVFSRKNP